MADENTGGGASLIDQVKGELRKSERESVKGKLKGLLQKRAEAEKTVRAIDLEIQKVVDDFEAGLA